MFPHDRLNYKPTVKDVVDAISCVLTALVCLHRRNILHNDIRWPNVMKSPDDRSWKLVDFDHASFEQGPYLGHWKRKSKAFDKCNWVASPISDLCMVGLLIKDASEWIRETIPPILKKFGEKLESMRCQTATDAVNELERIAQHLRTD